MYRSDCGIKFIRSESCEGDGLFQEFGDVRVSMAGCVSSRWKARLVVHHCGSHRGMDINGGRSFFIRKPCMVNTASS